MINTRTLKHPDGRTEVLRVLSPEELSERSLDDPLAFEKSIVWLEDVSQLPFVREMTVTDAKGRRGSFHIDGVQVLGYSKLTPDSPTMPPKGTYSRRIFYVKKKDLGRPESKAPPSNAVQIATIIPGTKSVAAGECPPS